MECLIVCLGAKFFRLTPPLLIYSTKLLVEEIDAGFTAFEKGGCEAAGGFCETGQDEDGVSPYRVLLCSRDNP
jgi:hypothetical protein